MINAESLVMTVGASVFLQKRLWIVKCNLRVAATLTNPTRTLADYGFFDFIIMSLLCAWSQAILLCKADRNRFPIRHIAVLSLIRRRELEGRRRS